MQHLLAFVPAEHVRHIPRLRPGYAVYRGKRRHIVLRQPQRADYFQIHQFMFIKISISGIAHIRSCRLNTRIKSHAQRHDQKDRKKTVEALSDFHIKIFSQCPFFHRNHLPLNIFYRHWRLVDLCGRHFSVLNVNHAVRHRRDRRIVRNHNHRHSLFPAHILKEF